MRNCVRRLPQVFDPEARPWVVVDAADADNVAATIETCPTGALHYRRLDGGRDEESQAETTVEPRPNGPLFLRGPVGIVDPGRASDSGRHARRAVSLRLVEEQAFL